MKYFGLVVGLLIGWTVRGAIPTTAQKTAAARAERCEDQLAQTGKPRVWITPGQIDTSR